MRCCPNLRQLSDTLTKVRHEAGQIMEENDSSIFPLLMNGMAAYSITPHDLLRAWIDLGTEKVIAKYRVSQSDRAAGSMFRTVRMFVTIRP